MRGVTALYLQTADGRNYSTQLRRNVVEQYGRSRFAVRPISFAVGNSGPRVAQGPCRSSEFLPFCVLWFLLSAVCF
jgi:hypothetical protein